MNSKAAPVKDAGRPRTLRSVAEPSGERRVVVVRPDPHGTILAVHGDLPRPAFLDVAPGGDIYERGALGSEEAHRQQARH